MPVRPLALRDFFVVLVMLSIGLRLSGGELVDVLRNPGPILQDPVGKLRVYTRFRLPVGENLSPDASVGILLLAAIPGTPIALQFTRMAKTRLAFAAVMTFVLSLASIALTPLAVEVMPQTAQRNERPFLNLIASVLLYIAVPLCAGLWMALRAPQIVPRLVLPLEILATIHEPVAA